MNKWICTLAALLFFGMALNAQVDSASIAKTARLLEEYVKAMETLDTSSKNAECDYIISSCVDSALRQSVAAQLYTHYADSRLMGEEAVAVHIFDTWFADGSVKMPDGDFIAAKIFAEFNRSSLLGLPAPGLELEGPEGETVLFPDTSLRRKVVYFYDVSCAKCSMESILLRHFLGELEQDVDFYAVYCGSDGSAWKQYREERLAVENPRVKVFHAWDPEGTSDLVRKYGVLQTPRLFLVDRDGTIAGRRLDVESLRQILDAGAADDLFFDRNPLGSRLPSLKVEGTWRKGSRSKDKTLRLDRLRGRNVYLVFYTRSCSRCEQQLGVLDALLDKDRRSSAFLVDMDSLFAESPETARQILDAFDLRLMPHILTLDCRGRVTGRNLVLDFGESFESK